jgi:hypothetical protein
MQGFFCFDFFVYFVYNFTNIFFIKGGKGEAIEIFCDVGNVCFASGMCSKDKGVDGRKPSAWRDYAG